MSKREDIRNVAIIAHVDHGKTTLVDALLKKSGTFRKNQKVEDRVMDSSELEREHGITIMSKNTAIHYGDTKINIIDTPGHADFGGEVERVLKMCDGVVLVVDAFEGPMPQTKFVMKRAIELQLPAVVCVNKVDRPDARPQQVEEEVLELFISLDAPAEYLDSPVVFASARDGWASDRPEKEGEDMSPLLDAVVDHIPAPEGDLDSPFRLLISTSDYNDYVGSIGIGKISEGVIHSGEEAVLCNYQEPDKKKTIQITQLFEFDGLKKVEVDSARMGAIVAVSGVEGMEIGDTLCSPQRVEPMPFVKISEPTLKMTFMVNDSPFAGQSGKYVTSRQIRKRLYRELETDVSLRVEEGETTDQFVVSGRGELHLSILIEKMRREGYEFQVSKPEVLMKTDSQGKKLEPIEEATIDVDQEFSGIVIEKMGRRKGELYQMTTSPAGYTRMVFRIPARGLIGYRGQLMTDTKGTGIINTEFYEYGPYKGEIEARVSGSLVSFDTGISTTYGLHAAQERGELFIGPGEEVYEGQIVGQNPAGLDINVNVCKKKHLTNTRAAASDDALVLTPPEEMTLEQMMEFLKSDERIEVTPDTLRLRKEILDSNQRYKSLKYKKNS